MCIKYRTSWHLSRRLNGDIDPQFWIAAKLVTQTSEQAERYYQSNSPKQLSSSVNLLLIFFQIIKIIQRQFQVLLHLVEI